MANKKQDEMQTEIMKELGFDKLSEDKQDEILSKIGEIILKRIFIETIDRLDQESAEKFKEMLKGGEDADKIEEFLGAKIENYDMIVGKIVEEVKEEIMQ